MLHLDREMTPTGATAPSPCLVKDRTSHLSNGQTDLPKNSRFPTVNRRSAKQDTILIRLVCAGFIILISNTFIRPLTAGHIPNRDQHSDSPNDAGTVGLKLQSRKSDHQEMYLHQRQRRDAENIGLSPKDLNDGLFAEDPNDELNCTPRAVEQFPDNFMSPEFVSHGGVIFNILISFYMFFGLAIVCDDYFVPSLIQLRDAFNISPDISGATFMAIGGSTPELFTTIIAVLVADSDVGVGTVAGSALFNVLFIMGCCAFATSSSILMNWWPVFRDSFSYMAAILALVTALIDERIFWYEALSMLLLYCMYIIMLCFNKPLETNMRRVVNEVLSHYFTYPEEKQPLINSNELPSSSYRSRNAVEASTEDTDPKRKHREKTAYTSLLTEDTQIEEDDRNSDADEINFRDTMTPPSTLSGRLFCYFMLPLKLLLYLTIPDSRRPSCHRFCVCTFILSILWIGILTYIMVWMATVAGDALNIPDTVIGFTILAAGTGIPDCFSSYFVAKEGHGDMAYANSVGSNIFVILVCLGVPWLIQASVKFDEGVVVHSRGLSYSILILLMVMFIFYASLMVSEWTLTRKHGYFYFGLYGVILIVVCLYEMNYFGPLNLPPCPR